LTLIPQPSTLNAQQQSTSLATKPTGEYSDLVTGPATDLGTGPTILPTIHYSAEGVGGGGGGGWDEAVSRETTMLLGTKNSELFKTKNNPEP